MRRGIAARLVLAVLLLCLSRARAQTPGPVVTQPSVPFRPGLASTGRLDFTVRDMRTIRFDRGRRSATATVSGNNVQLYTEEHPGALVVLIRGNRETTVANFHGPSFYIGLWPQTVALSERLDSKRHPNTLRMTLPVQVDASDKFVIYILSPADIEAAGAVGLALQGTSK